MMAQRARSRHCDAHTKSGSASHIDHLRLVALESPARSPLARFKPRREATTEANLSGPGEKVKPKHTPAAVLPGTDLLASLKEIT